MAIETVVQFADDQLTKAKDAREAAAAALSTAANATMEANARVADIGTELAKEQGIARELQAAPRPSAAAAREMAEQQAQHEIVVNALTAKLSTAREAAARAAALDAEAQADLARWQARVDELQRLKQTADAAAKEWDVTETAVQAVRDAAVSIPDAVDALKATNTYRNAEARVNAEVPQKLRTEGRKRADDARATTKKAIDDEQDAIKTLAAKNKAHRGKVGDAVPARLLVDVNQRLVREAAGAAAEIAQIEAKLEAINSAPPLTTSAVDLETAGTKAITDLPGLRTKVADAVQKVNDKKQEITAKEEAIAAAPAGGIDPAPLEADLAVLEGELPGLEAKVVEAEQAYATAVNDLDLWEAAVPDAAWQRLLTFDEAARRLTELKNKFTPAKIDALRADLKAAEKDLVKSLEAELTALREIEVAELAVRRQQNLAAAARELHDMNQLAAIRGDA